MQQEPCLLVVQLFIAYPFKSTVVAMVIPMGIRPIRIPRIPTTTTTLQILVIITIIHLVTVGTPTIIHRAIAAMDITTPITHAPIIAIVIGIMEADTIGVDIMDSTTLGNTILVSTMGVDTTSR